MIPLDIISDPICPWCYIGKAGFDRALAKIGSDPFTPAWRIFQLNPEMPAEGIDRRQYLEWKFGGPEGASQVYGRIEQAAAAAGLEVNFDRINRTPNTFDAHRLIRWSQSTGLQGEVVDQLFRRYFIEGEDIGQHTVLLDVAETVGMERDVIAKLLTGDTERSELEAEEAQARQMGVTGVPCFIINGRHVVQGAQDQATWEKIISELSEALASRAASEAPEEAGG
ncbi:MAG: DsbA family oxidoreductase [Pseudomonadota bacterium]